MILVTGAGGSNGSELTKQLSAKGASVRAMVRKRGGLESGTLPGVEFVTADFENLLLLDRRAIMKLGFGTVMGSLLGSAWTRTEDQSTNQPQKTGMS